MMPTAPCELVARCAVQVQQFYEHHPVFVQYKQTPLRAQDLSEPDMLLGALLYATALHARREGNVLLVGARPQAHALLGWEPVLGVLTGEQHQIGTLWYHHLQAQLLRLHSGASAATPKELSALVALVDVAYRNKKHPLVLVQ